MSTAEEENVSSLGEGSREEIQYHLYVIEKVVRGLEVADIRGGFTQDDAEQRLGIWLTI